MELDVSFNGRGYLRQASRMSHCDGHTLQLWITVVITLFAATTPTYGSPGPLPSFTSTPLDVHASKGYEAVLRCGVENLGTKTVSWRKLPYNVPITVGKEQFLEIDRFKLNHVMHTGEWNLHIKNAQPFDSGTYECQISLKHSKIRRNVTLTVTEAPVVSPIKPTIEVSGTQFVEKGSPILLTCNVTSQNPPESIDWFKHGRRVQTSYAREVYIHQHLSLREHLLTSTLNISKARMSDMGEYVCRATKHIVTRIKVDVLNAETNNEKRDTPYHNDGDGSNTGASYIAASGSHPTTAVHTLLSVFIPASISILTLCRYFATHIH